jgi:hypothetical protein
MIKNESGVVASSSGSCTCGYDSNTYKYMPHAFKCTWASHPAGSNSRNNNELDMSYTRRPNWEQLGIYKY